MADSDDEYTGEKKRSRDKFESERSDHEERSRAWSDQRDARNAGWEKQSNNRGGHQRTFNNRNYNNNRHVLGGPGQRRLSDIRDRSPSNKRVRIDANDRCTVSSTYANLHMECYTPKMNHDNRHRVEYIPPVRIQEPMPFKIFLQTLPGDVDEFEAIKKYKEYKSDFLQTKIEKFFDAHKDEEWFRAKYHPEDRQKHILQQRKNMKARLQLYKELSDSNYLNEFSLDIDRSNDLIKLIDAVVLKLEGDAKESIKVLLDKIFNSNKATNGHTTVKKEESKSSKAPDESSKRTAGKKPLSIVLANLPTDTTKAEIQDLCKPHAGLIRVSLTDPHYIEGGHMRRKAFATFACDVDIKDICWKLNGVKMRNCEIEATVNREILKRIRDVNGITSHKSVALNDLKNAATIILNFDDQRNVWDVDTEQNKCKERKSGSNENAVEDNINDPEASTGQSKDPKESNNSDVQSSNIQSPHKSTDKIECIAKSFKTYDTFYSDFTAAETAGELGFRLSKSKNPLFRNIGMYLVEESSAEEEELLGYGIKDGYEQDDYLSEYEKQNREAEEEHKDSELFERSEEHITILDKLLLYLRIVHSFDYYSHIEYKHEDDMPNRLGIMHVRGPWPPSDSQNSEGADDKGGNSSCIYLKKDIINDYINDFNNKIKLYTHGRSYDEITEEQRLIMRDFDIELNSDLEECVSKKPTDKVPTIYVCKHCTKKFEKVEFLKKHVLNKHPEATAVILADVDFFNSYLFDPHRLSPVPPEELMKEPISDPMARAVEAYSKLDAFVREPAPRGPSTTDPRAAAVVDYGDISFEDAI